MSTFLKDALEIVKAQAGVRTMSADEITGLLKDLTQNLDRIAGKEADRAEPEHSIGATMDPKKSIREKTVVCLECGKEFKVLTKRHLTTHGLTPKEYKAKWGLKNGTALVAKALARERRKKMKSMRLWEKRSGTASSEEE